MTTAAPCVRCHKGKRVTKNHCEPCAKRYRATTAAWKAWARAAGRCIQCGAEKPADRERCDTCRPKYNATWARSVKKRMDKGQCEKCTRKRAPGDARFCAGHRAARALYEQRRRAGGRV